VRDESAVIVSRSWHWLSGLPAIPALDLANGRQEMTGRRGQLDISVGGLARLYFSRNTVVPPKRKGKNNVKLSAPSIPGIHFYRARDYSPRFDIASLQQ
jgi:hypothetical protein